MYILILFLIVYIHVPCRIINHEALHVHNATQSFSVPEVELWVALDDEDDDLQQQASFINCDNHVIGLCTLVDSGSTNSTLSKSLYNDLPHDIHPTLRRFTKK